MLAVAFGSSFCNSQKWFPVFVCGGGREQQGKDVVVAASVTRTRNWTNLLSFSWQGFPLFLGIVVACR